MTLRVDLSSEQTQKFNAIKKSMGVKNNTEVIRSLINHRYQEIQPVEAENVELEVAA